LFEAIDYAYRRNLEKRCNQTKKKVSKFMNGVKKNQSTVSEENNFFMCYAALKLVGEKEE
jgi:transcription initiation factor IIE alpha subunit